MADLMADWLVKKSARDEYLTRPGTVYMLGTDHEAIHIRVVRTFCRVPGRTFVMEVVKS